MKKQNYAFFSNLEEEFGDQYYLFNRFHFLKNIDDFYSAFSTRYPSVSLSHSYKTNYTPYIATIAKSRGLYAEVVSGLEYCMALRVGYEPENIIFNGPIKTEANLRDALLGGAIVNVDHLAEVDEVCKIAQDHLGRKISVGFRCNADYGARVRSRFGMAEDSGELSRAFAALQRQKISMSLEFISIHLPSGQLSPTVNALYLWLRL